MLVSGIHYLDFQDIVTNVSRTRYNYNVICKWEKYPNAINLLNPRGTRWRGQVTVRHSDGPGARRSASMFRNDGERYRLQAACWHAFRDVFESVFLAESVYLLSQVVPPLQRSLEAGGLRRPIRIATSMATYTNGSFDVLYPLTGSRNVGSFMLPVTMPQLCSCEGAQVSRRGELAARTRGQWAEGIQAAIDRIPEPVPVPGTGHFAYQETLDRIDQVIAGVVKVPDQECLACGKATGSPAMLWCSQDCQAVYQYKASESLWK